TEGVECGGGDGGEDDKGDDDRGDRFGIEQCRRDHEQWIERKDQRRPNGDSTLEHTVGENESAKRSECSNDGLGRAEKGRSRGEAERQHPQEDWIGGYIVVVVTEPTASGQTLCRVHVDGLVREMKATCQRYC